MSSRSRAHLATKTCHIRRVSMSDGRSDLPVNHLADIKCTPIMSAGGSTFVPNRERSMKSGAFYPRKVMIFGKYEIERGDVFVLDGKEYPIGDLTLIDVPEPFMVLYLEDVQSAPELDIAFER